MATFTLSGRTYEIAGYRLGEQKALALINDQPLDLGPDALIERFARIVEAGTARFGEAAFKADFDEFRVDELTAAAGVVLHLAGFARGEA
jgi:hypothetical protein